MKVKMNCVVLVASAKMPTPQQIIANRLLDPNMRTKKQRTENLKVVAPTKYSASDAKMIYT